MRWIGVLGGGIKLLVISGPWDTYRKWALGLGWME